MALESEGKPKILLVGPLPPPLGSTTVSFAQLVEDLATSGAVVTHVLPTNARKEKTVSSIFLDPLKVLGRLLRLIPQHSVITFHASSRRMLYFGCALLIMCRLLRRPLILRVFGGSFAQVYQTSNGLKRRLYDLLFQADKVLLETHQMVDFFSDLYPSANIEWFSNSRPLKDPDSRRSERRTPLRFIFVSHVEPAKGVRDLIAAARLLEQDPGDYRIDVYGPLLNGLEASEFGDSTVTYCGVLEPSQVTKTLEDYDVFLLPTHQPGEGYPGAIIEAYTIGLPVIASRIGGIPEIVEHGVDGLLITPKSVEELAGAIGSLVDQPDLRQTLSQGAYQSAERYSSEIWHKKVFVDICSKLS